MLHSVHALRLSAALCTAAALVACDSSKHTAPNPTGNLAVTVTAADGTMPSVKVTGPSSYTKVISSTQVVTTLPLGSYIVAADSATLADSIVGGIVDTGVVTGSPATLVTARDTVHATVAYGMKQRYGVLWFGNVNGPEVDAIGHIALRTSGSPIPVDTFPDADVTAMALDTSGNLYALSLNKTIRQYTVAQRSANGDTSAAVTLTDAAFTEPLSLGFDSHGNLWVGDRGALRSYSPSQLTAGGSQTASIIITSGAINETVGLAFDSSGNLWLSNFDNSTLIKYTAAQLAASGAVDPTDTLASIAALQGPVGMRFDAHGNLWVANHSATSIVMFAPNQLTGSGSPTPTVVLTTPSGVTGAWGLAFDARGSLWETGGTSDSVLAFTSAQLAATGSPTPAVTLGSATAGQFVYVGGIVFDPWVPIGVNGTGANRVRARRARAARQGAVQSRYPLPNTPLFARR